MGVICLVKDYFAPNPIYPIETFRQSFHMRRHVFLLIVEALLTVDPYFQQRCDALGKKGVSLLQKCTVDMCMLAYGVSADAVDDYVCIGESIAIECLYKFIEDVILVLLTNFCIGIKFLLLLPKDYYLIPSKGQKLI